MDDLTRYDDDIYAWSREQAAVLRDLTGRRDLPNALDLENVAEEIESVGSEARNAVQSFIRLILVHLVKAAVSPHAQAQGHWRVEIANFHAEIADRYTRSMAKDLDLDLIWGRALVQAEQALADFGEALPLTVPGTCPLALASFVSLRFDFEGARAAVTAALEPRST